MTRSRRVTAVVYQKSAHTPLFIASVTSDTYGLCLRLRYMQEGFSSDPGLSGSTKSPRTLIPLTDLDTKLQTVMRDWGRDRVKACIRRS